MLELTTCPQCHEPVDESNSAVCNSCERRFHLRLRNDSDGQECGQVWINEQSLSLEFACFSCLGVSAPATGEEPPVGSGH